jgi:Arc/MetJ family transcription regulator
MRVHEHDLDEKLFQQARQLTDLRTKKAVMEEALRWLVRLNEQAGVRELRGQETDLLDRARGYIPSPLRG